MPSFHTKVSLRGFHFEDYHLTGILAAGILAADVGKAVAFGGAPNTFKLAGDGETIVGRLATVEDRKVEGQLVGTIAFHFANTLPIKAGQAVAAGDTVVGAGGGEVKKAAAADHNANFVAEVIGNEAVVVKV
ncbi:hypothetical protein IB276_33005 [Ensifer sp. ENS04]|uniref:hypothetical protein n=1 Tax=Ensifer sp. ENS04 TaxID=2769281 RepID=UPI001780B0E2|nr:hypothetical protein [Ensifer sp. ENS04]MBD9544266.1 hypothetical protein [Ensifer sp. ENS04]